MPENEIDDVIKRCLQNDQSACTQLYQQFADGVYRLCYGLVMNKHDAEDVVQDSFVYAF
jgi:RNA polymerase sigma-70 factor (ECF subfamily)